MTFYRLTAFSLFFIFLGHTILEAQDSLDVYQLNKDIVVTANRIPTAFNDVARTVTVISNEEIQNSPAQSVPELLENVLGVDVQQRGTQGIQADISIRGAGFNQTLILINGLKLSDPQTGHHNMDLPIDLSDIDKIEILKGPGSRLYGPNAFGGVINIITKKSKSTDVTTGASFGEHDLYTSQLNLNLPAQNSYNRVTFSKSASNGYKYNTDFHNFNFSQNSQLNYNDLTFLLSSGYNEKHFGANDFYIPIFPNPYQYEETKLAFARTGIIYHKDNLTYKHQFYFRKHNDKYYWNKFSGDPNIHESKTMGTELSAQLNHSYGITSMGFEYIDERLESNSLGIEENRNRFGLFNHERKTAGFFLQHQFNWNDFILALGASLYHYSSEGWHGWPGIDISYRFSPDFKVYTSYAEGFRVPTYTNLYLSFPATASPFVRAYGNPNLKNEESKNYELGYSYLHKNFQIESAVFRRYDKNLIDYVYNPLDTLYMAENFTKLSTTGFEGSLKIFKPFGGIKSIFAQYSYLDLDINLAGKTTIYAQTHFRQQLISGVDLSLPFLPEVTNTWKIRYEDRILTNDRTTIDTRLSWKNETLRLYLDVTNVLDEIYEDIPGIPLPGRWVKLGFEYNLIHE